MFMLCSFTKLHATVLKIVCFKNYASNIEIFLTTITKEAGNSKINYVAVNDCHLLYTN